MGITSHKYLIIINFDNTYLKIRLGITAWTIAPEVTVAQQKNWRYWLKQGFTLGFLDT